jgi:hypothetical protein
MKSIAIGVVSLFALSLCACTGTGKAGMVRQGSMDDSVDIGKVIAVNQWALKRGATVVWINYPKRAARAKPAEG